MFRNIIIFGSLIYAVKGSGEHLKRTSNQSPPHRIEKLKLLASDKTLAGRGSKWQVKEFTSALYQSVAS